MAVWWLVASQQEGSQGLSVWNLHVSPYVSKDMQTGVRLNGESKLCECKWLLVSVTCAGCTPPLTVRWEWLLPLPVTTLKGEAKVEWMHSGVFINVMIWHREVNPLLLERQKCCNVQEKSNYKDFR